MHGLLKSLGYSVRLLRRSPAFTITAILILGFGIGANTAIFSLIDAVLLKPLPYPHPEQLMQVNMPSPGFKWGGMDYPDYEEICAAQHSFASLSLIHPRTFDLRTKDGLERLYGESATGSFFEVLQAPFILGRPFTEKEAQPGGPSVVVINERTWRSVFNSDRNILGAHITMDGQFYEVIGVVSEKVEDWTWRMDVFTPVGLDPPFHDPKRGKPERDLHSFVCCGRLKPGVNTLQAEADLSAINARLAAQYPITNQGYGISVNPILDVQVSDYTATLWLLGGAVACILVIACANVASLLLVRALDRSQEIAVRVALGASRSRLLVQLLLENALLVVFGGLAALIVAPLAIAVIKGMCPQDDLTRFHRISMDPLAFAYVLMATLLVSLLFGAVPALGASSGDLDSALRRDAHRTGTTGRSRQRLQSVLIAGQVALACTLIIGAGLLVRSYQAAQNVSLGFNPGHLLTAQISRDSAQFDADRAARFFDQLLEKVRVAPGVISASIANNPPFNLAWNDIEPFGIVGRPDPQPGENVKAEFQSIAPDYFRTMGIPFMSGRDFNAADEYHEKKVAIINQVAADRLFPGENPLGKQIRDIYSRFGEPIHYYTIVGVVANSHHDSPDVPQADFQIYFPYTFAWYGILLVRVSDNPTALLPVVRKLAASIDPDVPLSNMGVFEERIANRFATRRLGVLLVGLFSAVALFLSAIGLYALLAYSVRQQTREIGIRISLGAQTRNILELIVRRGSALVFAGLLLGISVGLLLARLIQSMLFQVSPTDPVTLGVTVLVLVLAASVACLLPALRALRINPVTALRE
jgi:predicted permease